MWSDLFASLSLPMLAMLWGGALLGGLAAGSAGFAFGIVASAVWLHVLEPLHATFLIVTGGLAIQAGTIWPLRHSMDMRRLWPALLAVILGVPVGVWLLVRSDGHALKSALGTFLMLYGVYALLALRLPHIAAGGRAADTAVALLSGVMGGIGGYSGVAPAIWSQLRGWPKDVARAFYQPLIVTAHIATIAAIGAVALDRKGLILFALALPALALGARLGWMIYGRLDERRFRQVFAALLIASGLMLVY
jgi:uncharacterized membrane protein YfcA